MTTTQDFDPDQLRAEFASRARENEVDAVKPRDARAEIKLNGRGINITDHVVLVYGPNLTHPNRELHNQLYRLSPDQGTPDGFDCDGFYVPNDRFASEVLDEHQGPLAVKYADPMRFYIWMGETGRYIAFANHAIYRAADSGPGSEHYWEIPSLSSSETALFDAPWVPA